MRTEKKEIPSRQTIDKFIMECSVVRLGMISRGEPYVVPLNFVYDEGIVYFHCSLEGRKIEAIRANPRVCLEFDAMHGVSVKKQTTYYTRSVSDNKRCAVTPQDRVR